jgi:TP901 family phage tail tape measure protein
VPITLKVGAQADNRSFKQAADQAVSAFAAAGKEASGSFSKGFSQGAKDVKQAVSQYAKAYDAVADASGKANVAERQRQQALQKSETLAAKAAAAEKKLQDARDSGDTKAAGAAEKELARVMEQVARNQTAVIRNAEAASRARRQEQREIRDAVAAYRELQNAQSRPAARPTGSGFLSGLTSQSSGVVGQFTSMGGSAGKAFVGGAVAAIVAGGLIAAGAKAAGMVVDGFKSVMDTGIDFSKTVNNFQGVTQSTAGQTAQMSNAARALGADTSMAGVSASDAAKAMTELAKAGFTVDEAVSSARGTMQLATAAQIDAASAAEIQANAINAFGLSADDASHVADVLANAAVGSSADIPDLGQALQQVGGVAKGFGNDIESTVAALGMFANAGIKGSDAGTLLKTTLQSITDKGNPAQEAIKNLGLSLYDFDTGQFVGFRELFRQLDEAKKRMSPQQFQAESNVLFGTDAMRAAMLGTVADFDTMANTIGRVGTAANMAKAQMQGWPGIVEGVDNTVESLKLSLYDMFNTPAGQQFGQSMLKSMDGLVDWVDTHKPEILGFISDFVSMGATGTDAFLTYVARMLQAGSYMQDGLSLVFGTALEGIAKLAEGIGSVLKHLPGPNGILGEKLEGAGQAVDDIMDKWQSAGSTMRTMVGGIDELREGIRGFRDDFTGSMGEMALGEQRNRLYAQSFKQIQSSVELVPETKQIVITDNSPEVQEKLRQMGMAVTQLPDGRLVINVEYRDPSGKLVDPSQLGVSQRQLDDRDSRQHNWGINPPAVAPTTGPAGAWTPGGSGSGSTSLPDAPVLPIDYTNTAGMTAELANAQSRVDETTHDLAEKQARLNQLLSSNVADEGAVQKARNDVAKAQQDATEAQTRFTEAQRQASDKQSKTLKGATSDLNELGAQLDSDFGISKGLSGIADNLVRFLGALALAGPMAKLSAISNAHGDEGSGLMGILASNGVFGEKFLPTKGSSDPTGTAAMPSGSTNPNVDAMFALAQASSGRTKYAGASDLVNGLADCSGSISDLYEVLTTGRSTSARMFDTTAFASDASAAKLGFLPGFMPGALNVGVNPYPGMSGHMAATLPNGVNFEGGGGTGGGAQYGGSASGAMDPQFEKHYYLPVGGSTGAPVGPIGPIAPSAPTGPMSAPQSAMPAFPVPLPVVIVGGALPTGGGLVTPPIGGVPAPGVGASIGAPAISSPSIPAPLPAPGGGVGGPLGTGFPQAAPIGLTAPTGVTGQAYPSQGGGGGGGIGAGGMAMDAAMLATSGLDMMAPGAGAAAKVGIQLANRTIKYAGQVAGIGASGLLETFLPAGDNPKASIGNSWLGKILGGVAGASPALPNMAGGKTPDAAPGGGAREGAQAAGNTINNTLNQTNNHTTADVATGSAMREMSAMNAQPGKQ